MLNCFLKEFNMGRMEYDSVEAGGYILKNAIMAVEGKTRTTNQGSNFAIHNVEYFLGLIM